MQRHAVVAAPGRGRAGGRGDRLRLARAAPGRTGDTNVDVVEAFHFVEYSALTCCLPGRWRRSAGGAGVGLGGLRRRLAGRRARRVDAVVRAGPDRRDPRRRHRCRGRRVRPAAWPSRSTSAAGSPTGRGSCGPWRGRCGGAPARRGRVSLRVVHLGSEVRDAETGAFMSTRLTRRACAIELGRPRARRWGSRSAFPAGPVRARGSVSRARRCGTCAGATEAMDDGRRGGGVARGADSRDVLRARAARRDRGRARGARLSSGAAGQIAGGRQRAAAGRSDASPIPIVHLVARGVLGVGRRRRGRAGCLAAVGGTRLA